MRDHVVVAILGGNSTTSAIIRIISPDVSDVADMPDRFEGEFLAYGDYGLERIVRAERRGDATDPVMYLNGGRGGYRFWMDGETNRFFAKSLE